MKKTMGGIPGERGNYQARGMGSTRNAGKELSAQAREGVKKWRAREESNP